MRPTLHPARLAAALAVAGAVLVPVAGRAQASAPTAPLSGVAKARADSARLPWTEADAAFMLGMIGHHAQAIAMSRLAPSHGASPEVQTLAARIINAQRDEIVLMQQWLRDRGRPTPAPDTTLALAVAAAAAGHAGHAMPAAPAPAPAPAADPHAGHAGHDAHAGHGAAPASAADPHAGMPGMLSAAELRELDAARGERFDERFLELMVRHHRGAVTMVRTLFDTPAAAQDLTIQKFAQDVQVDQTTEIARMQRMLLALRLGRFGAPAGDASGAAGGGATMTSTP